MDEDTRVPTDARASHHPAALKLFYCYSHRDKELRDELDIHLAPLKRSGDIVSWYDGEISPGVSWEKEIEAQLDAAQVILLLISPYFLASDYCYSVEMQRAIEKHNRGQARVIPILLRPSSWEQTPFSKLHVLPEGTKPVTLWGDRNEALTSVANGIHKAIEKFLMEREAQGKAEKGPVPQRRHRPSLRAQRSPFLQRVVDAFIKWMQGKSKQRKNGAYLQDGEEEHEVFLENEQSRQIFTALDVGTAFAKAVIIEVDGEQANILGVGQHPQSYTHMSDGIVTDVPGVIANCNKALLQAEQAAGGIITPLAVVGIAGELVKGQSFTVSKQRQQPRLPITRDELEALIISTQEKLYYQAREAVAQETGYQNIEIRLINISVVSVSIDGQPVSNPMGIPGKNLSLMLFSSFAPLMQIGALETVAQGLDFTLVSVVAHPYALARCLVPSFFSQRGAIIIDIGGGTTDIALVRNGGIEGTRMFAVGGRTFTRHIASNREISLKEAEKLKFEYSLGKTQGNLYEELKAIIASVCTTWMDSVELLIEELSQGEVLPPSMYLVGGGSALPDILTQLTTFPWQERLPFSRPPEIRVVKPEMVSYIFNPQQAQNNYQYVTPLALGYVAVELENGEANALEPLLYQAIDKLNF